MKNKKIILNHTSKKSMNYRNIIIFIVAFVGLILFQREAVMPLVMEAVKSDLFLTDSEDLGDRNTINNSMTNFAHMHCNRYIAEDYGDNKQFTFLEKPINAWNMGDHNYIINSELEFNDDKGNMTSKKYVCRIQFTEGGNSELAPDYENWSVYGISGLDDI